MIAAMRSSPECNASDRTPKLPVRITKKAFSPTSSVADPTLSSAARFFSRVSSYWPVARKGVYLTPAAPGSTPEPFSCIPPPSAHGQVRSFRLPPLVLLALGCPALCVYTVDILQRFILGGIPWGQESSPPLFP